jgi:hypothetical protein
MCIRMQQRRFHLFIFIPVFLLSAHFGSIDFIHRALRLLLLLFFLFLCDLRFIERRLTVTAAPTRFARFASRCHLRLWLWLWLRLRQRCRRLECCKCCVGGGGSGGGLGGSGGGRLGEQEIERVMHELLLGERIGWVGRVKHRLGIALAWCSGRSSSSCRRSGSRCGGRRGEG